MAALYNMKLFLRIILTIVLLSVAAIYFNSAAGSAWLSSGPPINHTVAWSYRAMRHFYYGVGFLVIAVTSFLALKTGAKKVGAKFIIGSVVALGLFSVPHLKKFIDIDSCLDQSGRWDYEYHRCEK